MSIVYNEEEILRKEDNINIEKPFIGYISPKGDILDFSVLIGEPGHGNWRNPATPCFLSYISFVVLGKNFDDYRNSKHDFMRKIYFDNKYDDFDDIVRRGLSKMATYNTDDYNSFLERLNSAVLDQEAKRQETAKMCGEHGMDFKNIYNCWNDLR